MPVLTSEGWLVGNATAIPEEGLYSYSNPEGEQRILMPAKAITGQAFPWPQIAERCKLTRSAVASYARSRWGPGKKEKPWQPVAAAYDSVRPQVEALLGHALWGRFDVVGSLVHLAMPREEAAVTIDLACRFHESGGLGLLAVWCEPPAKILEISKELEARASLEGGKWREASEIFRKTLTDNPQDQRVPWAELGAGVAAMADAQIPVEKTVVIWVSPQKVRLEAKPAQDALEFWCDAVSLARAYRLGFGRENT